MLQKFYHYCFAKEVSIITNHNLLVAIINKDVTMLSQQLQHIMLPIHQHRVHSIYKHGPDLYIVYWLSLNNHTENRNQEIIGINLSVHVISTSVNIPVCTSIEDIQTATHKDADLQKLKSYIIKGWPHKKDKVEQSMKHC